MTVVPLDLMVLLPPYTRDAVASMAASMAGGCLVVWTYTKPWPLRISVSSHIIHDSVRDAQVVLYVTWMPLWTEMPPHSRGQTFCKYYNMCMLVHSSACAIGRSV